MSKPTDCRKCRNYSRLYAGAWCNAVEDRIVSLTGFPCPYYEGPHDPECDLDDDCTCGGNDEQA